MKDGPIRNLHEALSDALPQQISPSKKKTPRIKPMPLTEDEIRNRRSCLRKHRYKSATSAKNRANYEESNNPGLRLSYYKCPNCHRWHLTSHPKPTPDPGTDE